MRFLTPIYRALLETNNKAMALEWYNYSYDFYSPYAQVQLGRLINGMQIQAGKRNL